VQNGESGGSGKIEPGLLKKFWRLIGMYARNYSDAEFWKKAAKFAKKAGKVVLKPALTLFYAAKDEDTPKFARATMIGALGYFISPLDAIPDFTPLVGYTDDLWMIVIATAVVAAHIKEEHKKKAEETLNSWFGEDS